MKTAACMQDIELLRFTKAARLSFANRRDDVFCIGWVAILAWMFELLALGKNTAQSPDAAREFWSKKAITQRARYRNAWNWQEHHLWTDSWGYRFVLRQRWRPGEKPRFTLRLGRRVQLPHHRRGQGTISACPKCITLEETMLQLYVSNSESIPMTSRPGGFSVGFWRRIPTC